MAENYNVGALVAHWKLDNSKWDAAVKKVKKDSSTLSSKILGNQKRIEKMGKSFAIAGALITGAFIGMLAKSIQFNKSMATVATLIPQQRKRIGELSENVRNLGETYAKNTDDISDGLYQVISAFGDTADTAKILETNVMAAAAGMATTKDAINLTSAVTKGYGKVSAEATKKAADLAFMTVKLGQTTFPELASSIGRVIPVAATMKVKQEELFAGFATLTGVTGSAAEVSTQLAGVLRAMLKPTKEMTAAIGRAGFESADMMIKQLGLVGSLKKVIAETDGSKVAIGKLFGRAEALNAVFALTETSAGTFTKKLNAMSNVTGSAKEAFKEISEGVNKTGFEFEQAKVKLGNTIARIGDTLLPFASKVIKAFTGIIDKVQTFIKEHPALVGFLTETGAKFGILLTVLGGLLLILPKIVLAYKAIKTMILATNPILLITVAAVTAVTIAIGLLTKSYDAHNKAMGKIAASVGKYTDKTKEMREFMKVASDEEKKWMQERIKDLTKMTGSHDLAAKRLLEIMAVRSQSYRDWVVDAKKSEKEVVEDIIRTGAIKANVIKMNLEKWRETEGIKFNISKELIEKLEQLDEDYLDFLGDQAIAYNEFLAEQAHTQEMLKLEGYEADKAALDFKYIQDKLRINDLVTDEQLADDMKKSLHQTYLDEKAKMDDKYEDELKKKRRKRNEEIALTVAQGLMTINSAYRNYMSARLTSIDAEYEKEKQYIIDNVSDEAERERQLTALDEKYNKQRLAAEQKAARTQKALSIVAAIINTAVGVTKALQGPFPLNLINAAIVAAAGALQIAAIKAQPIPMAEGGMTTGPTSAIVGDNPSGHEAIIPLEKIGDFLDQIGEGGQGGKTVNVYIQTIDTQTTQDFVQNNLLPYIQDSFQNETLLVPEHAIKERVT